MMASQTFDLTEQQAEYILASVKEGKYPDANAVIDAALRLQQDEAEYNRVKLEDLRRLVKEGFDAHDRGEYEVVTKETLGDFMESVSAIKRRSKSA